MTPQEFEAQLREAITDGRLSGSERHALKESLTAAHLDEQRLGVLRSTAFRLAREQATHDASATLDWLEDVCKLLLPPTDGAHETFAEAHFGPGVRCVQRVVAQLSNARHSADLCVFTITDDRIASAVIDAHRRGVAIRVLTDDDKADDPGSDVGRFRQVGIPVRVDHSPYHMHHKFAVFDGATLLNGSYNWTRAAAECNYENLVATDDHRLIAAFQAEFERLWARLA